MLQLRHILFAFALLATGCNPLSSTGDGTSVDGDFRPGFPGGKYAGSLVLVSGDNQSGTTGSVVTVTVGVLDAAGLAVPDVTLSASVLTGGGSTPASVTTDSQGHASIQWTIGSSVSAQTLQVSGSGFSGNPSSLVLTVTGLGNAVNAPTGVTDGNITASTTAAPAISWTASSSNVDADFAGYQVALGTSAGGSDILGWTNVGNVTTYTPNAGFTLVNGTFYYASVRAYRTTGATSAAAMGNGFAVNTTAAVLKCDYITGTTADCYASPYGTVTRPQLRATRASGAGIVGGTYVNSSGTITTAPSNILLQSQNFLATWGSFGTTGVTITSVANPLAPDGTATAFKIQSKTVGGNTDRVQQAWTAAASTSYVASFYVQNGTANSSRFQIGLPNTGPLNANLTWTGATLTAVAGGGCAGGKCSFTAVGNNWYRVTMAFTTNASDAGVASFGLQVAMNAADNLGYVYLWGAQLETGTGVSSYIYTTAATAYGARIDHDPGSCNAGVCTRLGLLVEEARTNVALSSRNIAAWTQVNTGTVAAGADTAPDGTTTADTLNDTDAANVAYWTTTFNGVGNTDPYTASVYVKKTGAASPSVQLSVWFQGGTSQQSAVMLNPQTGAVSTSLTTPFGYGAVNAGSYWRVWVSAVNNGTGNTTVAIALAPSADSAAGTGSATVWGGQLEYGLVPTSFIPTTAGSTATRSADLISIPGFSNWFNQTHGTLMASARTPVLTPNYAGAHQSIVEFHDTTANNRVASRLENYSTNKVQAFSLNANVTQYDFSSSASVTAATTTNLAWAYDTNDFAASALGETASTDASGQIPTVTALAIGSNYNGAEFLNGHIRKLEYYDQRLGNAILRGMSLP